MLISEEIDPAHKVQSAFDQLASDSLCSITAAESERAALRSICARPEFRPLLKGIRFRVCPELNVPFRTLDAVTIELASAIVGEPALAAVHIRHALELAVGYSIVPVRDDVWVRLAVAILACNTALRYLETTTEQERDAALRWAPRWLRELREYLFATGEKRNGREVAEAIGRCWPNLLPLQGINIDLSACGGALFAKAHVLAENALPIATPTERILTMGGDSRLLVDEHTRLNGYGCSPSPRPWAITFSSCTASSISDLGYQAAESARQSLYKACFAGAAFGVAFTNAMDQMRNEVASVLSLDRVPGTEVIFSPSGTDCELYALYFALAANERNLVNVLVAPNEIGSGSLLAAQGRHFDGIAPMGRNVEPHTPVNGIATDRLRVECLQLRDDFGVPLTPNEIDGRLRTLVARAAACGDTILVHLLDSSKTGLRAPSIEAIRGLQTDYGPLVLVVVDAAQMRIDREGLTNYLEAGFMVIISGSKFYTGPPFSGALLVPPAIARLVADLTTLPQGFSQYLCRYEIPPCWAHLRTSLSDAPNIGLFLRWRTALWEMQAFHAVTTQEHNDYFQSFTRAVLRAIARYPQLELVESPVGERNIDNGAARWDRLPTIFTFLVNRVHAGISSSSPLSYEEARLVYGWLNRDISALLPDEATYRERAIAAKQCHIGQPVRIRRANGTWLGAVRIAVAARFVSRVRFDPDVRTHRARTNCGAD